MKTYTNNKKETSKTATRFALQGMRYSRTHVAQSIEAKVGRGLRTYKLASLVNNF
jgi:hypothetical protein